jgi:hypothetical protein
MKATLAIIVDGRIMGEIRRDKRGRLTRPAG